MFQRIAIHPRQIVLLWGIGVCTGFIAFRGTKDVLEILDQCISEHLLQNDDQVAMNLAFLELGIEWRVEPTKILLDDYRKKFREYSESDCFRDIEQNDFDCFNSTSMYDIVGKSCRTRARLLGLGHDKFWRHGFVANAGEAMVVCHPNSPREDDAKMKVLASFGASFTP